MREHNTITIRLRLMLSKRKKKKEKTRDDNDVDLVFVINFGILSIFDGAMIGAHMVHLG